MPDEVDMLQRLKAHLEDGKPGPWLGMRERCEAEQILHDVPLL